MIVKRKSFSRHFGASIIINAKAQTELWPIKGYFINALYACQTAFL
jgi:hypothetical protein